MDFLKGLFSGSVKTEEEPVYGDSTEDGTECGSANRADEVLLLREELEQLKSEYERVCNELTVLRMGVSPEMAEYVCFKAAREMVEGEDFAAAAGRVVDSLLPRIAPGAARGATACVMAGAAGSMGDSIVSSARKAAKL